MHLKQLSTVAVSAALFLVSCSSPQSRTDILTDKLNDIIINEPGQFGIAIIIDNSDTITINNTSDYPLMSMFKLHEAIAVCRELDNTSTSLDTIILVDRMHLDLDTWSPMLKKYTSEQFNMSVKELISYCLIHSDNNASNILFDQIISVSRTDSLLTGILSDKNFNLKYTERQMKADNALAYENVSSPLSYAVMINTLFNDSITSREKQDFIKQCMLDCNTGLERLGAPLSGKNGVTFAHRTGTGYLTPEGKIVAVNDGGYVKSPTGKAYTIVVMVKDYAGSPEDAEKAISMISAEVYDLIL